MKPFSNAYAIKSLEEILGIRDWAAVDPDPVKALRKSLLNLHIHQLPVEEALKRLGIGHKLYYRWMYGLQIKQKVPLARRALRTLGVRDTGDPVGDLRKVLCEYAELPPDLAAHRLGICVPTYYRWCREVGVGAVKRRKWTKEDNEQIAVMLSEGYTLEYVAFWFATSVATIKKKKHLQKRK